MPKFLPAGEFISGPVTPRAAWNDSPEEGSARPADLDRLASLAWSAGLAAKFDLVCPKIGQKWPIWAQNGHFGRQKYPKVHFWPGRGTRLNEAKGKVPTGAGRPCPRGVRGAPGQRAPGRGGSARGALYKRVLRSSTLSLYNYIQPYYSF